MKTKFFKTGLPIMAFLMAIGLAFATDRNISEDDQLVSGYIWNNSRCEVDTKKCNNVYGNICTTSAMQPVYKEGTSCSEFLYHTL